MELDEYKTMIKQQPELVYRTKKSAELEGYLRQRTDTLIDIIKKNLRIEISFAVLFLLFDGYLVLFSAHTYLKLFAIPMLVFCVYFIYILTGLLKKIRFQQAFISSVQQLLESYINIVDRFTRLYFQLTMVMIPFAFLLAFISGYLNYRTQSFYLDDPFSSRNIWLYFGIAVLWSFMMYFFTRWYIRKLYGDHLNRLKQQLRELREE